MNIDAWTNAFSIALTNFLTKIADFLPNFLATLIIVVAGLYCTRLAGAWFSKGLAALGVDKLCDEVGIGTVLRGAGFQRPPSYVLGILLRIFLVLLIILSAAETLGLEKVSAVIDQFVSYLPKVAGAVLIILGGVFIGHHFRVSVRNAMEHLGVDYGNAVAQMVQAIVLIITFSLAISQLDIDTKMFDLFFAIIIAAVGLGAALSLGLGARGVSGHLIAGVYLREQLTPGDTIEYDGTSGIIITVGSINTIIERKDESHFRIPNNELMNKTFATRSHDGADS